MQHCKTPKLYCLGLMRCRLPLLADKGRRGLTSSTMFETVGFPNRHSGIKNANTLYKLHAFEKGSKDSVTGLSETKEFLCSQSDVCGQGRQAIVVEH